MINSPLFRIFNNRLIHNRLKQPVMRNPNDVVEILYRRNSLGFRGDDFNVNNEILFLGCSHTYGDGLMEEDTWPSLVAKKMNLKFSNLGEGGDSAIGQVIKAFQYFETFGNPKIIVALFPSNRMPVPYVLGKMQRGDNAKQRIMVKDPKSTSIEVALIREPYAQYSKAPHDPEYILTEEMAFFYEQSLIDMLRVYCNMLNIKLVWSNWEPEYQDSYYEEINKYYPEHHKEYCFIEEFGWNDTRPKGSLDIFRDPGVLSCHKEHNDHPLFYQAADSKDGRFPHWGTHKHIHIAEAFLKHIESINLN